MPLKLISLYTQRYVRKCWFTYNLLVSYPRRFFRKARREVREVLKFFGDENPRVEKTIVAGLLGVKTCLDVKALIREMREGDGTFIRYTFRWIPVERWVKSDIDSMKEALEELASQIEEGETWRMTVEKRRYSGLHKSEIIRELAEVIDRKVDLENPDKVVMVEIIGGQAGISVLQPEELFSSRTP